MGPMAKINLTLQLDEEVVRHARVVAAKRGTSVSALVKRELTELVAQDERYEAAMQRAFELMARAAPRGGASWTRDELYAERLDRHGSRP
jgi:plasmid stability protein